MTYTNIKWYEWSYQINEYSAIRSLNRRVNSWNWARRLIKGQIIKPYINKSWYVYIWLYKRSKLKTLRVSRLMWETFLGLKKSNKKSIVLHLDNNKLNNQLSNLKVGTLQENTDQCIRESRFLTHKKRKNSLKYKLETIFIRFLRKIWVKNKTISEISGWSESYCSMIYTKSRRGFIK